MRQLGQHPLLEFPAYNMAEAASYSRVPYQTVRYWVVGRDKTPGLISVPSQNPPMLSYINVLECHVLNALRTQYEIGIKRVRRALETLESLFPSEHPLLETAFITDGVSLFVEKAKAVVNLSEGGQVMMREVLTTYLRRIEFLESGMPKFFPFVSTASADEPRIVSILPTVAFGRSVIDGTGIATAVVAARFNAREPVESLAEEYDRPREEIEEAIRWENVRTAKAA